MKWKSSFVPPLRLAGAKPGVLTTEASYFIATATPSATFDSPSLQWRSSLPPLQSSRLVMATATTAAVQPSSVVGFIHLFLSFVAGGIFFSSLLAGVTTFFAVGQSNISRVWSLAKSVLRQVWQVFVVGLNEARLALRLDGKWHPKEAWQVLKTKLSETREAASQGMDAIKAEKNFYAGAVGQPGLITFQYFINRLMPFSFTSQMENALRDSLKGVKNEFIRTITLQEFDTGEVNPTLLEARNYDLGRDALAFDVDVKWESHVYAKMTVITRRIGIKVPVTVRNATFVGTARIEMTPLIKEPPGWGAILISLPSVPKIGLRVDTIGGDLTKVPWLKKEILKVLQNAIEDQLVWPKRLVLPSLSVPPNSKTVISRSVLNELSITDPLLKAESNLEQQEWLKDHMNSMKPNITAVSSNLQVSVGGEDDSANGGTAANAAATKGKKRLSIFHRAKQGNPFTNLMLNLKNTEKAKSSTNDDVLPASSMAGDNVGNATSVPD